MTAADRLAALEQAHAAATPGPWEHVVDDHGRKGIEHSIWSGEEGGVDGCYIAEQVEDGADAAAIVAEHNATPLLIAALRAVLDLADRWERGATRWETPLPVPPEVALIRTAIDAALGVDSGQQT